ncbi:hypothetical protein CASFOL_003696 [Castilleja foliolosa]|uniref:Uncharacterized protein n=1 Tax=Castilleja foliolosa TaxID=1961234 RepID=A0ABD3EHX6_9LAMI
MDTEYSRKSGQIPAFGDWENANEMPITKYFECARQAGLVRCTCSGECGASFLDSSDLYGGSFGDTLPRRVYDVPRRKTSGINKGVSHTKDRSTKQFNKVETSTDRPRKQRSAQNHYSKQRRKSGNTISPKSSVTVKPVDEDLYKISPGLAKVPKRKKMLQFFTSCIAPPCAA